MKQSKTNLVISYLIRILIYVVLFLSGRALLGTDFSTFLSWWMTLAVITVTFYPIIGIIFQRFSDGGWMFAKVIGLALSGWFVWLLSSMHLMKFTRTNMIVAIVICFVINLILVVLAYLWMNKHAAKKKTWNDLYGLSGERIRSMLTVEIMFFALFLFWTYARGLRPEVSNTESPMDYGFMAAMMRTDYMPPQDIWLSGKAINYYYVGQYMATFLTKLSGVRVNEGYNLALMTIASATFTLSFSLIFNVMKTFLTDCGMRKRTSLKDPILLRVKKVSRIKCTVAGLIAGTAVTFAANMHYPIYKFIIPWIQKLKGLEVSSYWFPSSTRFIGYNPVKEHDKTIHEFPAYSFVLGDLHAHVINIIFVLSVLGLLYALLLKRKEHMDDLRLGATIPKPNLWREGFQPIILLLGFFIGLFHMTNYWDYPIYYVVCGAIILFSNAVLYQFSFDTIKLTAIHAVVILGIGELTALPFTLNFDKISSAICISDQHTAFNQLLILWGLPIILVVFFVITRYRDLRWEGYITHKNNEYIKNKCKQKEKRKQRNAAVRAKTEQPETSVSFTGEKNKLFQFIESLQISDLFIVTIGLCAIGLILLPEVIYVDDIYGDYKRANTMFKLTYQGFIMFGLCMGYIITRFLCYGRTKIRRVIAVIGLVLLAWTSHYSVTAMNSWFGNIFKTENYKSLDGIAFMENRNSDDYEVIQWLNQNITGTEVVLEANGDSYSDYCRLSAFTGLPTIVGWDTHEWLWRSGALSGFPPIVKERKEDVKTIYTSTDRNTILYYLNKYQVSYVYLGSLEADKFGTENAALLKELGDIVYVSPANSVKSYESVLIKIDQSLFDTVTPIDESLNDE